MEQLTENDLAPIGECMFLATSIGEIEFKLNPTSDKGYVVCATYSLFGEAHHDHCHFKTHPTFLDIGQAACELEKMAKKDITKERRHASHIH